MRVSMHKCLLECALTCGAQGSLHLHAILWTLASPTLLNKIAGHPFLEKVFVQVIKSMFATELPVDTHVKILIQKEMQAERRARAQQGDFDEGTRTLVVGALRTVGV